MTTLLLFAITTSVFGTMAHNDAVSDTTDHPEPDQLYNLHPRWSALLFTPEVEVVTHLQWDEHGIEANVQFFIVFFLQSMVSILLVFYFASFTMRRFAFKNVSDDLMFVKTLNELISNIFLK